MTCSNPGCIRNYDFHHIAHYAKKRFVDGCSTMSLLEQANTDREREEIALVCLLDVDDDKVQELQLNCKYAGECKITNCRKLLRTLISNELGMKVNPSN